MESALMSMFENYDNLNINYVPDNSSLKPIEKYLVVNEVLPRPLCNAKGRVIGYGWKFGEYFDFRISTDYKITVYSTSLLYNEPDTGPDGSTVGEYKGQKAYNTADAKSWTFVGMCDSIYMWIEDSEIIYPADGDKTITMSVNMTNKHISVEIYNHRWELLYSKDGSVGESSIDIVVDEELSETLKAGAYFCLVKIISPDSSIVKDKFIISID